MDAKKRRTGLIAALIGAAALSGCSSFGPESTGSTLPASLPPVTTSSVESSTLPPLGSADGTIVTDPNMVGGDPALAGQVANADGSLVSLGDIGNGTAPAGRNLSGGLTITKLLGVWTIASGVTQCRLNLTQTTKTGTSRYRASTPGCTIQGLNAVASWQLAGSQVQLFDEGGTLIGALLLNGEAFIGTLAGGQGVTMTG